MIKIPRKKRFIIPDIPYHIIKRGHNRKETFFKHEDYIFYLGIIKENLKEYDCKCYAYILMPNHIHMILSTSQHFSRFFQSTDAKYVHYINRHHTRSGALWEKRYTAKLIDSLDYFNTCKHYIENNSVAAKLCRSKKHYLWSSYHHSCHKPDPLISTLTHALPYDF